MLKPTGQVKVQQPRFLKYLKPSSEGWACVGGPPIPVPQICSRKQKLPPVKKTPGQRHPEIIDEPESGAVLVGQYIWRDGFIHDVNVLS
jgi:hypothetical protein